MENRETIFWNESREIDKQRHFEEVLKKLERVVDGLGKHIDPGIIETVAALQVNNFPTAGSCEGHVKVRFGKRMFQHPYMYISEAMPKERYVGETEIINEIAQKYGLQSNEIWGDEEAEKEFYDYIDNHDIPETPGYIKAHQANLVWWSAVERLVNSFNEFRQATGPLRIVMRKIGGSAGIRVTFSGENIKDIAEDEMVKYEKVLVAEQAEIRAFTEFLKDKYLNS